MVEQKRYRSTAGRRGVSTICGLDLSLAGTGLARITFGEDRTVAEVWRRPSRASSSLVDTHNRIRHICADVIAYVEPCALAVVEGPAFASRFGKQHERSWLFGRVVGRLIDHGVPVAVVPPLSLKAWATGNGGASKKDMIEMASSLWPGVELGGSPGNADKADGLLLATAGAQHLGFLPNLSQDPRVLRAVQWPDEQLEAAA